MTDTRRNTRASRAQVLRFASALLMVLAIVLGTWGATQLWSTQHTEAPVAVDPPADEEPLVSDAEGQPWAPLYLPALGSAQDPFAQALVAAHNELHRMFCEYVDSRVVAMEVYARLPQRYVGWEANDDFEAPEASPEGLLTRWEPNWYITHEWSWYGQQILGLVPGDVIEINGRPMKVESLFDYPKESFTDEIYELLGRDCVILQTCEPNSDLNRIVYGDWVS